jgi:hypothetical protein
MQVRVQWNFLVYFWRPNMLPIFSEIFPRYCTYKFYIHEKSLYVTQTIYSYNAVRIVLNTCKSTRQIHVSYCNNVTVHNSNVEFDDAR